ncbi:Uncharacterized protein FWK35_00008112, partial [Aphis craccivora]
MYLLKKWDRERMLIMDGQMNVDKNVDGETQYSTDEVNRVIFGQSSQNTQSHVKEDGNTLMQTLLKQNELLMRMLAIKEKPPEEVYAPPDLSKVLPTFDGKCKPHEAADWLSTLCGVASLHRWLDALKLEAARVNVDGPARQWYIGRRFNSWAEFEQ